MSVNDLSPDSDSPKKPKIIHLGIAVDWEYDADFIRLIEEASRQTGLATLTIWPNELKKIINEILAGDLTIRFLFDRASATSAEFLPLQNIVREGGTDILDPIEKVRWASDKATMHLEFIANGLNVPYTVILPPYEHCPQLTLSSADLVPMGAPFIIKPANTTGGSMGVVDGACTMEDIVSVRRSFPSDKYLLQKKIEPQEDGGLRFWFRGLYILGDVHCVWWDDRTHIYSELLPEDVARYGLQGLASIVRKIAAISGLRFFSTEIIRDRQGQYLIIDYVNELCDMRLQSRHFDGVPDKIVAAIASRISSFVGEDVASKRGDDEPLSGSIRRPIVLNEEKT